MGDDLRKEINDKFCTKGTFTDHKADSDAEFAMARKRLDDLEKESKRIATRQAE